MVRSADTQAKLGNLSREGQPNRNGEKSNSNESRFYGKKSQDSNDRGPYDRGQGSSNGNKQGQSSQRGGFNGQQDRDDRYKCKQGNAPANANPGSSGFNTNRGGYVESVLVNPTLKEPGIGVRLKYFASVWNSVSRYPWILGAVSEGLRLEFTSVPFQLPKPSNMCMNASQ